MADFEIKSGIGIIPEGTLELKKDAFKDSLELTAVEIPSTVTKIGWDAFRGCVNLKSVIIPEGVKEISHCAFSGCTSLASIEIPASVSILGWGVFNGCKELASIKVAAGNTVYDSREDCNAIIMTASNELLEGCKATVIPSSVTVIGVCAFKGTGLSQIDIPDSVTTIKGSAFENCTDLTSIVIPSSVDYLQDYSYNNYGGKFYQPFLGCCNLTTIVVEEGNPKYDSRDNCNAIIRDNTLFAGCQTTVIPESVKIIGEYAFAGMKMTDVILPDSIREIRAGAFADCESLKNIVFNDSLERIAGNDPYWSKSGAFKNCKSLESVSLPSSLRFIYKCAFEDCEKLTTIVVHPDNTKYDSRDNCNAVIQTADNNLIIGCGGTVIPESVTEIEDGAFIRCHNLTHITVPEGVTNIGKQAIRECKGLKSAAILGPVKELCQTFYLCSALESVTLGAGIKKMDDSVFGECPSLKRINVPAKKSKYYMSRIPASQHGLIVEQEPAKK